MRADLDAWITEYNEARPHQGRWCFGIPRCRPSWMQCLWRRRKWSRP